MDTYFRYEFYDLNNIDDDDWDNNSNTYIDDLIGWDPAGIGGLDDNNPDSPIFDASLIHAPVNGRMIYVGFRYKIK